MRHVCCKEGKEEYATALRVAACKKADCKPYKMCVMTTRDFEDKDIRYAYERIHKFFDNYHLETALQETEGIIKVATTEKAWKKDYPYSLIYFMKMLEDLCEAALVIHYNYSTRDECIVEITTGTGEPDMSRQQQFIIRNRFSNVWNCFPRHLSPGQYHNPYKAIKKFAGCMSAAEWKKALQELTEYALSDSPIDDAYPPYNILTVRQRLLQLIEACHLLEVRSNIKKAAPQAKQKNKKSKK